MRAPVTRRTAVLGALAAALAWPVLGRLSPTGSPRLRQQTYAALVAALVDHGALPAAAPPRESLASVRSDALPLRQKEIDDVLDALERAGVSRRPPRERIQLLRAWSAAGGERRALAARATALAAAAYGPADDRSLPVVI